MSRHAAPWGVYARFRDKAERITPGRHARNVSPTHVPAWPFNRRSA